MVGVCPGGTTSQLFTYWSGGDVALSISMTVFSTTAALGLQPVLLYLYMDAIDPNTDLEVAYGPLVRCPSAPCHRPAPLLLLLLLLLHAALTVSRTGCDLAGGAPAGPARRLDQRQGAY